MPTRLRLARFGRRGQPSFRIVAADSRSPRDGRMLEVLGSYRPIPIRSTGMKELLIRDKGRVDYWLAVGAQPTERVAWLLHKAGMYPEPPKRALPSVPVKLLIRDISKEMVTVQQLKRAFSQVGTVMETRLGKQKFGFVTMSTADEAAKAIEHVKAVNGIPIKLELAGKIPPPSSSSSSDGTASPLPSTTSDSSTPTDHGGDKTPS